LVVGNLDGPAAGDIRWIKTPRRSTGILDPHTGCAPKRTYTKAKNGGLDIVPGQPSRRIVCAKVLRELSVC
jgi:hypothetical protein